MGARAAAAVRTRTGGDSVSNQPDRIRAIATAMAAAAAHPEMQAAQTSYRVRVVDAWRIPLGCRLLEIGCGQGDMTAVLADAVGEHGHVTGVDIAEPSYGSPVTLGESAAFLARTPLGSRIDIRFGVDLVDGAIGFDPDAFDAIVLAHCSWYFGSQQELRRLLTRIRPWARRLYFAEWDLTVRTVDQLPHLLAVLIQGTVEAAGARGIGNVRTPFSRTRTRTNLAAAGWRIMSDEPLIAPEMQDADWEINAALHLVDHESRFAALPDALRDLVASEADTLRAIAADDGNAALDSYVITAERT
jgi:SAM-dependent methyltransferase